MTAQFSELSNDQFNSFALDNHRGSYLQTTQMGELLAHRHRQTYQVGLIDDATGVIYAAAILTGQPIHGGVYFQIDGGPLIDYSDTELLQEFTKGLTEFAKAKGGLYLRVAPNEVYREFDEAGEVITQNETAINALLQAGFEHEKIVSGWTTDSSPVWQYVKDLKSILAEENAEEGLTASYTKHARRYLNRAKRFGVQLREIKDPAELVEFKRLTQHTADRLHYHDKDLEFYQKVFQYFGEQAHFVLSEMNFSDYYEEQKRQQGDAQQKLARLKEKLTTLNTDAQKKPLAEIERLMTQISQFDEKMADAQAFKQVSGQDAAIIAGALFIQTPNEMIFMYSGTYAQYQKFDGSYMMQDAMLKLAVEQQIPHYNFYGISGQFDGSDGVLKFKQAFNGVAQQKVGTFVLPLQSMKYRLYTLIRKILYRR